MDEMLLTKTDVLFRDEVDMNTGAWLKNPANKFFVYSEGYREAGEKLYQFCIENPFYNNTLVYPLIFNYRQFFELRLKELILMGRKYLEVIDADFPDEHSLLKLWNIYRNELLPHIESSIDKDELDNVERIISQFNTEDPKSMSFRYPVSKAPERKESLNRRTVDLENFKNVIDKLIYFFDWQWDMISHYEDMRQDMLADTYREYWG